MAAARPPRSPGRLADGAPSGRTIDLHLPDRPTDRRDRLIRPAIRRIRGAWRHRFGASASISAAETAVILEHVASASPSAAGWRLLDVRPGDPALASLGADPAAPAAYLRVARSPDAIAGLLRAETAQRALADRLPGLIPEVIAAGLVGDARWLVESAVSGEPGTDRSDDAGDLDGAVAAVVVAVRRIHAASEPRVVGDADVERWIGAGLRVVRDVTDASAETRAWLAATERRLVDALRGATVPIGWIHGDLWLDNVRFVPGEDRVTGIVDWDSAASDDLALHDLVHLALTTRRRAYRREYGSVLLEAVQAVRRLGEGDSVTVGGLLHGAAAPERGRGREHAAGAPSAELDSPIAALETPIEAGGLDPESILLLAWLRFVATNVGRHAELRGRRPWIDANVRAVMR
jgi:aminoglycoside phosphotransferase